MIAAIGVVVWHIVAFPISNPFYGLFNNVTDLRVYRAGAQTILDGHPLYGAPVLWGLEFTYPPFSAIVFIPFALMGQTAANIVWWSAIVVALIAVIALSFKSLGYRLDRRMWVLILLLTVCSTALEPVRTTIWLGQINVFLMALVLIDLILLDMIRPNSRLRGIGVGLAAGLKLTPAFFVVYLLAIRRWRAAVTAVITFLGTVALGYLVVGKDAHTYWMEDVFGAGRIGRVDSPANQSVNGFISQLLAYYDVRRFAEPLRGIPVYSAPAWLWVPFALVAAGLGIWAAVVAHRRGRELLAVCIVGMTASTVSPFSWGHHWVWFVPLFIVAFDFAYRGIGTGAGAGWRWLAPATIVTLSFSWWKHWYGVGPHYTSDHPIAIGFFMMARYDTHWWDQLLVILYSGAYPLVLLLTIIVTLVGDRLQAARTADQYPRADGDAAGGGEHGEVGVDRDPAAHRAPQVPVRRPQ